MKTNKQTSRLARICAVITFASSLISVPAFGQDQTVDGNLYVDGYLDITGNSISMGETSTGDVGTALIYTDAAALGQGTLRSHLYRTNGNWEWAHGSGALPAMSLSTLHTLTLWKSNGSTAGIILSPDGQSEISGNLIIKGNKIELPNQKLSGNASVLTKALADSLYAGTGSARLSFGGASLGGTGSIVMGSTASAAGQYAFSQGVNAQARGNYSHAHGNNVTATGQYAIAFGLNTKAASTHSMALGNGTQATNIEASALGRNTLASGQKSLAFGELTKATGARATAFGYYSEARGTSSTAFGNNTLATGQRGTAFGSDTEAQGQDTTAFGANSIASGSRATAFGLNSTAVGHKSTAFGAFSYAEGEESTAFGRNTIASGHRTIASGHRTEAYGYASVSMGYYTKAEGFSQVVIGMFNEPIGNRSMNAGIVEEELDDEEAAFVIGNGRNEQSRSNAMTVTWGGEIKATKAEFKGVVRVAPSGDLPMGEFTQGVNPAGINDM